MNEIDFRLSNFAYRLYRIKTHSLSSALVRAGVNTSLDYQDGTPVNIETLESFIARIRILLLRKNTEDFIKQVEYVKTFFEEGSIHTFILDRVILCWSPIAERFKDSQAARVAAHLNQESLVGDSYLPDGSPGFTNEALAAYFVYADLIHGDTAGNHSENLFWARANSAYKVFIKLAAHCEVVFEIIESELSHLIDTTYWPVPEEERRLEDWAIVSYHSVSIFKKQILTFGYSEALDGTIKS